MKNISNSKSTGSRLADRIRTARHTASLSQAGLAVRVGVTPGAVAQWENPNGTRPTLERLEVIATVTGAAFDWLATGRGDTRRRKGSPESESTPAVMLGSFAQDVNEELLLERYRRLPAPARGLLSNFLEAMMSRKR